MRFKYDVLLGDFREMDDSAVSMSTTDRMSITPNPGEFIYDETEKKLYVGDGETVGGVEVLNGNVSALLALGNWTDEMVDVTDCGDWTRD